MNDESKSSGTGLHPSQPREPAHQGAGRRVYQQIYYIKNRKVLVENMSDYRKKNQKRINKRTLLWIGRSRERNWAYRAIWAKRKDGYVIKFSLDDLTKIALKHNPCRYCGGPIDYSGGKIKDNSPNLDRIENAKGDLELRDIQLICHKCNVTKLNRSHKEFVRYCAMVYRKFKGGLHD